MTLTEKLEDIVKKEKDIIPFLKGLDKKQKKELQPGLKKLQKYYSEFVQNSTISSSYSMRASLEQRRLLSIAAFVCLNQKDFLQTFTFGIISRKDLSPILSWYCPDWFADYVDEQAQHDFVGYDYDWYLELTEQGYARLNPQMIAKTLPAFIFEQDKKTWKHSYHPEKLLVREATLQEHIWYLFEFESFVHAADSYKNFEEHSTPIGWKDVFRRYINEGKIDRERALKESITASSKNFNQASSNWFMDLFLYLEPTRPEQLQLQNELLNTFNSPNSRPYNQALKLFKDLATEPGFAVAAFIDHAPLVLTAESKSGVSSALMILDKLAKKYPDERQQICVIACQALIHQDNALQVRAAKLIQKYGDAKDEVLTEAVQTYYPSLLSEARDILSGFSAGLITSEEVIEHDTEDTPRARVEIQMPQNFDEFVFLASQAFDQNEPYHFDLLPAALLKFQNEMTAENILKLMPAFQRAYKMITGDWTAAMGYLDNMLAKFFMSYGQLLVAENSAAAIPIANMHRSFVKLDDEKKAKWSWYEKRISGIKPWSVYSRSSGYNLHKKILLNAFFMLERKITLPLLSTPTHEPCWVSVTALIERLGRYQQANIIPGDSDIQAAVARCFVEDKAEALQLADKTLSGENRALIGFILGETHHVKNTYRLKPAWLVAAVTQFAPNIDAEWLALTGLPEPYLTGEFGWSALIENYMRKDYDYKQRKYVDVPDKRKIIKIHFGSKQKTVSALKNLLGKVLPGKSQTETSIYDDIELKYDNISAEHNDIKRLLYPQPAQPEILLAHVISKGLEYIDFTGENDKKLVTYTLETLFNLNARYGIMGHLFIASCMISSDKTIRTYAAELWIAGVKDGRVNSEAIGKIIGQHERIELAPLKRFTDLAIANMFQLSQKHNAALEKLLSACIQHMNDTPVNGCKKLVEIYTEVLSANKTKVTNADVMSRLKAWSATETLKKAIQKIPGA